MLVISDYTQTTLLYEIKDDGPSLDQVPNLALIPPLQ